MKHKYVTLAFTLFIIAGMLLGAPLALAQSATCAETYTVASGDTLGALAQKYLGSNNLYQQIADATNAANKLDSSFAAIADPNILEVGWKLCIPAKANGATTAPATTTAPVGAAAGLYTLTGPAADATHLVYLLTLDPNGGMVTTMSYLGKSNIVASGVWQQSGDVVTLKFTQDNGRPSTAVVVFQAAGDKLTTTQDDNQQFGSVGFTATKTSLEVATLAGIWNVNIKSADSNEQLVALTLPPDGTAMYYENVTNADGTLEEGTWQTDGKQVTLKLTKAGDKTIDETLVFELQADKLVGVEYNKAVSADGLTLAHVQNIGATSAVAPTTMPPSTPTAPTTTPPTTATQPALPVGIGFDGVWLASSPAADASALLRTMELSQDGVATMNSNYVGKGIIADSGSWAQTTENTADVTFTKSDDRNINDRFTFQLNGDTLTATQYDHGKYGENAPTFYRATSSITGTVSYLQKITLPDNAVVEVYLVDATDANAPGVYLGGVSFTTHGSQIPLEFALPYAGSQIRDDGKYFVQAFISADGRLLFKNSNGVAVLTNSAPMSGIEIVVEPPAQ